MTVARIGRQRYFVARPYAALHRSRKIVVRLSPAWQRGRPGRDAIDESDATIHRIGDPEALSACPIDGTLLSLRWVIAHMTSETARHAGHADILREHIDNVTGR
jgi:hypothetical protein